MAEETLTNSMVPALSVAGKIPFRSKKVRKSSTTSTTAAETSKKPRLILPLALSIAGELDSALRHLTTVDSQLAVIIKSLEPPSFHNLSTPFLSLSRSILYQQLATKAAASIYARFISLCGGEDSVAPEVVLSLTPPQLRQVGVSSRKASYLHDLASKYQSGFLSDSAIVAMDDDALFSKLTTVKGIGPWSVHMFMIFSLHRPDVLPVGDLGVRKGVQILLGLKKIPQPTEMEELCKAWRPYRSAAAWYMWRLVESNGKAAKASI
ncbi:probable DNA-3-methyladenine glycosylase 2 [Dendrobium catenatum]|uniref:probable DNA-3-methyladenine glycosylase 2 n=1 Tax=Dendrobium catenatum TaxID=906689 RepID=UPI0009F198F6|nr:probable DNA-3-methyladenine glycosylase 2 [Dendrobium catenatum]